MDQVLVLDLTSPVLAKKQLKYCGIKQEKYGWLKKCKDMLTVRFNESLTAMLYKLGFSNIQIWSVCNWNYLLAIDLSYIDNENLVSRSSVWLYAFFANYLFKISAEWTVYFSFTRNLLILPSTFVICIEPKHNQTTLVSSSRRTILRDYSFHISRHHYTKSNLLQGRLRIRHWIPMFNGTPCRLTIEETNI